MRTAAWLAARELARRPGRAAAAAALVAVAAALGGGLELVARSREAAAGVQVDGVGPAARVVPLGVGGSALARLDLGMTLLPPGTTARVRAALGPDLRELHERLVVQRAVHGRMVPVVGVGHRPGGGAEAGSVAAGAVAGRAAIQLGTVDVPVVGTRAATGSAEDLALFLPLPAVQRLAGLEGINDLQIFLRAGVAPRAAVARLESAGLSASVVAGRRGEAADEGVQGALARGRRLAQGVLALMIGLGLAVVAHLDAAERRTEVATLVAAGAVPSTVLITVLARSAIIAGAGGLAGVIAGAGLAAAHDPGVAGALLLAWPVALATPLLCLVLGLAAAGPTAAAMALRDPVAALQEG